MTTHQDAAQEQARAYRDKLLHALRIREVPGDRIGEVLAEVEAHVAETGEDPTEAFGLPREYADRVVGAGTRSRWRLSPREAAVSLLIGIASFVAASLTIGGALRLLGDGSRGIFGFSPWTELGVGLAVGALVVTVLVRHVRRKIDPVIDPRTGQKTDQMPGWAPPAVFGGVFVLIIVFGVVVDRLASTLGS